MDNVASRCRWWNRDNTSSSSGETTWLASARVTCPVTSSSMSRMSVPRREMLPKISIASS